MQRKQKKALLICSDILLIGVAYALAHFYLMAQVRATIEVFQLYFFIVSFFFLLLGSQFKIFSQLNRYTGIKEILRLVLTMSFANVLAMAVTIILANRFSMVLFSIRVFFLGYLFACLFTMSSRVGCRILVERKTKYILDENKKKRTLVIGAGSGADILFNRLNLEDEIYKIIGVLDDDSDKKSTYIQGHQVIGKLTDLRHILESGVVDHVILAIPSLNPELVKTVLDECNRVNVSLNTLPPVSKLFESDVVFNSHVVENKLRDIDITDLLGRDEVRLDLKKLSNALHNNTILVTGAGGSIGSEICRQVAKFKPHRLILLGHGEYSIYIIHKELVDIYGYSFDIVPLIADIQDKDKMVDTMERFRPNVVYHAAGHKHVPLMEANPFEAVKNNVFGTKYLAEAAKGAGVENFVMISSDKAVAPPNVMGATKRIAEMIVTGLNDGRGTNFSAVRFGNVLGSRGSVVPLFKEQIAKGGPLTITDFRMTRYFMTIPEASKLVIQAGTLARGGEIFILDMGAPVRIYDLARKIITLSGFSESEIQIVETGIRPGEKLFEELLLNSEVSNKNVFDKIFIGNSPILPIELLFAFIDSLENNNFLHDRLINFANNLDFETSRKKAFRVLDDYKKNLA